MDVYLVRHGQALSEKQDAKRPLSDEGRAAVKRVADHVVALGVRLGHPPITEIRHSGKLRAQQTAQIWAEALSEPVTPVPCKGMNPNDDPRTIYEVLQTDRDRGAALLLAGHLPHLALLTELLLGGNAPKTPVRFVTAALLKICPTKSGWAVGAFLTPASVP